MKRNFNFLYKEYYPKIFYYITRRVKYSILTKEDAEDIAQEVFIKLLMCERSGRLDELSNLWHWIKSVTDNKIIDIYRHRNRRSASKTESMDSSENVLEEVNTQEKKKLSESESEKNRKTVIKEAVEKAADQMTEPQKQVKDFIQKGWSKADISRELGVTRDWVRHKFRQIGTILGNFLP